jgi:hypothetical protein
MVVALTFVELAVLATMLVGLVRKRSHERLLAVESSRRR